MSPYHPLALQRWRALDPAEQERRIAQATPMRCGRCLTKLREASRDGLCGFCRAEGGRA